MAINSQTFGNGDAAPPARPLTVARTRTSRRILLDRVSSRLVVLGGIVIIASILAILLVIAAEVYPLFSSNYRSSKVGPLFISELRL